MSTFPVIGFAIVSASDSSVVLTKVGQSITFMPPSLAPDGSVVLRPSFDSAAKYAARIGLELKDFRVRRLEDLE